MKKHICIIGSGAREHAIGWKLSQSPVVGSISFLPGNGGTTEVGKNVAIPVDDIPRILDWVLANKPDMVVIGPELPLAMGLSDQLREKHIAVIGPSQAASQLETSKVWATERFARWGIPHPSSRIFRTAESASRFLESLNWSKHPQVIKADGLAMGKGVFVPDTVAEALVVVQRIMRDKEFGDAGNAVVMQQRLTGKEVSVLAFCDGKTISLMPAAADYKRIFDGDKGPNTGGMGAISPVPYFTGEMEQYVREKIMQPTIRGLAQENIPYQGVLYAGLMITDEGPQVLEFNVRMGDPETQVLLCRMDTDLYTVFSHMVNGTLSQLSLRWSDASSMCVVLAAAGYPGVPEKGISISGLKKDRNDNIHVFHAGTEKAGTDIKTSGGRVLAITATGNSFLQAQESIYGIIGANGISFTGMQYRKDIATFKPTTQDIVPFRLEVVTTGKDSRIHVRQAAIADTGFTICGMLDVYTIDAAFTVQQKSRVMDMLANPVTQQIVAPPELAQVSVSDFTWAIEIGFLPGVTDNVGSTVKELIAEVLKYPFASDQQVYTSQVIFVRGMEDRNSILALASGWYNPLIQRMSIKSYDEYVRDGGMDVRIPKVHLRPETAVLHVDLHVSDEELTRIGKEGIANTGGTRRGPLALDLRYLRAIRNYFDTVGRHPTDIELESIAQTWSEHCKHTIFADPIDEVKEGLFKSYIKKATEEIRRKKGTGDFCVSVFTDNSGAIEFDDEYLVTDKVETHNSPSALDPFGGAITGIVGVNRDALGFGMGAKPILNRYGFCFSSPDDESLLYRDKALTQPLLSSKRIINGVIDGVNSGGNCSGIPTTQGFMYFDERYRGKPLIFVGTVGLIPKKVGKVILSEKMARLGDYIVMAGGKVGLDGIHGATFSSEALTTGSPATAVQIGDPITQKKLSDVIVREARDLQLYHSITDNGAGGLSCSVAEMAKECGGCLVELEKVPLKYPGLEPWQIWISESQERMTLAVPPDRWEALRELCSRRGVDVWVIGKFTDSGRCRVDYQQNTIMDVSMEFLHYGLPVRAMTSSYSTHEVPTDNKPESADYTSDVLQLIGGLNIASIEQISSQYDHEVQGTSVIKPLQGKGRINTDATVIRPVFSSAKGVIVSQSLYPAYTEMNAYKMAAAAIDTAIRNCVTMGADINRLALLDNFCWCSSTEPERLGQLKAAVKACYDYALAYGTPFISGKDSMFNDFKGYTETGESVKISVPPTLLISVIGTVPEIGTLVTPDAKFPGDSVYLLGGTANELGGSEYYRLKRDVSGIIPTVNGEKNRKLYEAYYRAIQAGLITSAQSLHLGGLAAALAKSALGGRLGMDIFFSALTDEVSRNDVALFSESQGRILVTVAPQHGEDFEALFGEGVCKKIGEVTVNRSLKIIGINGKVIVNTTIGDIDSQYRKRFGIVYHYQPKAMILSGYGLNCEDETAFALRQAGAGTDIVHINDLVEKSDLEKYEMLVVPGGFSFGDDTGSGNAYALKLRSRLWDQLLAFVQQDHLILGICNGFQVLVNLGLLPALDGAYGTRHVALTHNDSARYIARWVDLQVRSKSPWFAGITSLSLPIAHGEGKLVASAGVMGELNRLQLIAARYTRGELCRWFGLTGNPNGSTEDAAALTDVSGRILGLMPHPERAIAYTQMPNWTYLQNIAKREGKQLPTEGPGLSIFRNGVSYFCT